MRAAHLIYFSPTGTTQKIVTRVAVGLGAENVTHYDLTLPGSNFETVLTDGVAIIGVPVSPRHHRLKFLPGFRQNDDVYRASMDLLAVYG